MTNTQKPDLYNLFNLNEVNADNFPQRFPDEEAARLFFEIKRWPYGVACSHCGSTDISECKNHTPMPYRCRTCRNHFSVRYGTVLEGSKIPLLKWVRAIHMITEKQQPFSIGEYAKYIGVSHKTAGLLADKIRQGWDR